MIFDEYYYIELLFECWFDYLEVWDGLFGFFFFIDCYCGVKSFLLIRLIGRFMWIKFSFDEEFEGLGFWVKYLFILDLDFIYLGGILNFILDC